jgi:hypothetical protein
MAKKLTMLPPPKEPPNEKVVAILKSLLQRAEQGDVNGLALVAALPRDPEDGKATFSNLFIGNPEKDLLGFLGSLDILKTRILHHAHIPERDGIKE